MTQHYENRYGQAVFTANLEKVVEHGDSWQVTYDKGMTFSFPKWEAKGFVPKVGDFMVLYTTQYSLIQGIIIEGTVIRYRTAEQVEVERQRMLDGFRLEKLERYVSSHDTMMERVRDLPKPLHDRMMRFASEGGIEFWIESADYEMAAVEGAAALIRILNKKVPNPLNENDAPTLLTSKVDKIKWIEDWWSLNTSDNDYNYAKQMELVPDFGDGHSGFTASAAKGLAIAVLQGKEV